MTAHKLMTIEEAKPAKKQHRAPCLDCPWSREAIPGWLGGRKAMDWVFAARSDARIDCHTRLGQQCAGSSIYRANTAKLCRQPDVLKLSPDHRSVFSNDAQFVNHHTRDLTIERVMEAGLRTITRKVIRAQIEAALPEIIKDVQSAISSPQIKAHLFRNPQKGRKS